MKIYKENLDIFLLFMQQENQRKKFEILELRLPNTGRRNKNCCRRTKQDHKNKSRKIIYD